MSKKIIIIVLIAIVALTSIAVAKGLLNKPKKQTVIEPILNPVNESPTPTPTPKQMTTYTDPAGFSFDYPSTVTFTPKKMSDKTFYADIEITSDSHEGNIQITVKDITLSNVKNWMTKEGYKPLSDDIKEIPFAGLTATQFTDNGKIITAVIDQKVLFTIIVDLQKDDTFWKNINNTIISSFAFSVDEGKSTTPNQSSSPSTPSASDEIDEGVEEIVE